MIALTGEHKINLDQSWLEVLSCEFDKPYMKALSTFLRKEKASGEKVFPCEDEIFNALNITPLHNVRVVILGQDPYHGVGQAHGLSFSVREGMKIPPSLQNIYKEIARDFNAKPPPHGDLTSWAEHGVLLLNATLTVREGQAGSHQNQGWESFTDAIICAVNALDKPVVFMLWGAYAQKKGVCIDQNRHLVLSAPHPSPLSAHRGFIGCGHFSKANDFLVAHGSAPVKWAVSCK